MQILPFFSLAWSIHSTLCVSSRSAEETSSPSCRPAVAFLYPSLAPHPPRPHAFSGTTCSSRASALNFPLSTGPFECFSDTSCSPSDGYNKTEMCCGEDKRKNPEQNLVSPLIHGLVSQSGSSAVIQQDVSVSRATLSLSLAGKIQINKPKKKNKPLLIPIWGFFY